MSNKSQTLAGEAEDERACYGKTLFDKYYAACLEKFPDRIRLVEAKRGSERRTFEVLTDSRDTFVFTDKGWSGFEAHIKSDLASEEVFIIHPPEHDGSAIMIYPRLSGSINYSITGLLKIFDEVVEGLYRAVLKELVFNLRSIWELPCDRNDPDEHDEGWHHRLG